MQSSWFCILIAVSLWFKGALAGEDDHGMPHAVAYDLATFHANAALHPHFIMFYAPWFVFVFVSVADLLVCSVAILILF